MRGFTLRGRPRSKLTGFFFIRMSEMFSFSCLRFLKRCFAKILRHLHSLHKTFIHFFVMLVSSCNKHSKHTLRTAIIPIFRFWVDQANEAMQPQLQQSLTSTELHFVIVLCRTGADEDLTGKHALGWKTNLSFFGAHQNHAQQRTKYGIH